MEMCRLTGLQVDSLNQSKSAATMITLYLASLLCELEDVVLVLDCQVVSFKRRGVDYGGADGRNDDE
jgi:hypothetical protein